MSETHLTDTRFDSFALDARILAGLREAGFERCTPIQAEALPIALSGRDVAGQAQTGTGKTAAYLVAALHHLLHQDPDSATETTHAPDDRPVGNTHPLHPLSSAQAGAQSLDQSAEQVADQGLERVAVQPEARTSDAPRKKHPPGPRVLILAPTRELAVQIHKDAEVLAKHTGFRLGLAYGGTGYQQQRDQIAAGVDILIGTPGRLIDYFKQRVFNLKAISVVVLDEADRMFDLGFIKDIRFLLRRMPPPEKRLGMLFSATLSYRVTELAYEHMNDPLMVEITPDKVTADRVTQCCYMVGNDEKIPLLIGLLRRIDDGRVMVFINTKRQAELVWGYLEGNGIESAVLSGDVPQKQRLRLLRRFQEGELPVLVATDVAARGLHIPDVSHVINYDLPDDPEDYVHRIGRTARAGAAGDAISFACETYAFCLPEIEDYIGAKIPVEAVNAELLAEIDPASRVRPPRRETRGRDGKDGRRHGHDRHGHDPKHKRNAKHGHDSKHKHDSTHDPEHDPKHHEASKHARKSKHEDETPNKPSRKAEGNAETDAGEKPKKRRRRRSKPKSDRSPREDGSTSPSAAP